jgi:hypothetical protein
MSNSKISALASATTPLAGTEVLPVVQSSATTQVTVANLTAGRAVSAASLALTTSPLPATSGGTGSNSAFTANGVAYASSTTVITTSSALVFDGANLGLAVTPSAYVTRTGFDINTWGGLVGYTNQMNVTGNAYFGASNSWRYKQTGVATRYAQDSSGAHYWFIAPSGTAGAIITFTQAMTLDASGNLSATGRFTPRVLASTANSATPTLNTDNYDMMVITGQTLAITSFTTNLTGTPVNGQKLLISITGTAAVGITWGASFEASTTALPTTTVTTNRLDVGFIWNVATSKWRCLAVA